MVGEWEELELKKLVDISTDKVELATVEAENYISTDNMLPNFGGIDFNLNKPSVSKTSAFRKMRFYSQTLEHISGNCG